MSFDELWLLLIKNIILSGGVVILAEYPISLTTVIGIFLLMIFTAASMNYKTISRGTVLFTMATGLVTAAYKSRFGVNANGAIYVLVLVISAYLVTCYFKKKEW